jgi:ferredoxin
MASKLFQEFAAALPYDRYLANGTEEQQRRWTQVHEIAHLITAQQQLAGGFVRNIKVLVCSGIWCGDCVQQCPLIYRIAQGFWRKVGVLWFQPATLSNGGKRRERSQTVSPRVDPRMKNEGTIP